MKTTLTGISRNAAVRTCSVSGREVFSLCKRIVYPPCKKPVESIELTDCLASDLGYVGDSGGLLAFKTNEAFQLVAPHQFTSLDLCLLRTVEDHVFAVCTKLARARRLVMEKAA